MALCHTCFFYAEISRQAIDQLTSQLLEIAQREKHCLPRKKRKIVYFMMNVKTM